MYILIYGRKYLDSLIDSGHKPREQPRVQCSAQGISGRRGFTHTEVSNQIITPR